MERFEYHITIYEEKRGLSNLAQCAREIEWLNEFGDEGWEVITSIPGPYGNYYVFKRQKERR